MGALKLIDKYHKKHDDPKGKAEHFPGSDQERRVPQHIILIDPAILSVLTEVDIFRNLLSLDIRLAVNLPGCFSLPCTGFFFFSFIVKIHIFIYMKFFFSQFIFFEIIIRLFYFTISSCLIFNFKFIFFFFIIIILLYIYIFSAFNNIISFFCI